MYLGPDVLMPVASVVAAVVGFVLTFWRRLTGLFRPGSKKAGRGSED